MQQTEKYKFKIIETSDTFSPDALNENTEDIEKELARVEAETETRLAALADAGAADKAELQAADAALLTAIGAGGHTARIACGSVTGSGGGTRTLKFDFKPLLVVLQTSYSSTMLVRGAAGARSTEATSRSPGYYTASSIVWSDNSVTFSGDLATFTSTTYYIAIGVSPDVSI